MYPYTFARPVGVQALLVKQWPPPYEDRRRSYLEKFTPEEWERLFEDERYLKESRDLSLHDAIPVPPRTMLAGGCPVGPIFITESNRPLLINFSRLALDHYNHHQGSSGASFEFDDLVKSTHSADVGSYCGEDGFHRDPAEYYITFKIKQKGGDPSHAITIFQAKVLVDQLDKDKPPVVAECHIKI